MKLELKHIHTNGEGAYKHTLLKSKDVAYYCDQLTTIHNLVKEVDFSIQKYDLKFEIIFYNKSSAVKYIDLVNGV